MSGAPTSLGEYNLLHPIASGGMATVYLGRRVGPAGFSRVVAIKRLNRELATDPEVVTMFLDEARLAARVRHPNVVSIVDVLAIDDEPLLVMEYVDGESLARLADAASGNGERVPLEIVSRLATDVLEGLDAAHEATGPEGEPLGLVHRDVSPHNVLVGSDGRARVIDFGVAKAKWRLRTTRDGRLHGRLRYMAPELVGGREVTRRADVYSVSVILWELLTGRPLFDAPTSAELVEQVLLGGVRAPSMLADIPAALDAIVLRGLHHDPRQRFASAREMALALAVCVPPAAPATVAEWVERIAGEALRERAALALRAEAAAPVEASPPRAPEAPAREVPAKRAITNAPRTRGTRAAAAAGVFALAASVFALARVRADAPPRDLPAPAQAAAEPPSATTAAAEPEPEPPPTADTRHEPPPRRPAPTRYQRPASRCAQPYVVDGSGHRIYRRECL